MAAELLWEEGGGGGESMLEDTERKNHRLDKA